MPTFNYDRLNITNAGNIYSNTVTTSSVQAAVLSATNRLYAPVIFDLSANNLSDTWNTAYNFNNTLSSLILGDLTVVATNSAEWTSNPGGVLFLANSAMILGDLTYIQATTANWNTTYTWLSGSSALSANWNLAYTYFTWLTANSGAGGGSSGYPTVSALILGDLTNIATTSANWNTSYTFANSNSSLILGDLSVVAANSAYWGGDLSVIAPLTANWNASYSALTATSGNWNLAYTFFTWLTANSGAGGGSGYPTVSALILGDLTNIAGTSANWNTAYSYVIANSATASDISNIATTSANWNTSYSFLTSNSALILGDLTNVATTSTNWNTAYTFNNTTSSLILGDLSVVAANSAYWGGDLSNIAAVSANWNNAYSALTATSGQWNSSFTFANTYSAYLIGDESSVAATSATWNTAYTYSVNNSGILYSDHNTLTALSANWNNSYSALTATSGNWNSAYTFANTYSGYLIGDESSIAATSATWNAAWTFSSSNSSLILGDLTVVATNSAYWGGDLSVIAPLTANWNASYSALTATSGVWNNTTNFVQSNSSLILGDLTVVATNSAYWATGGQGGAAYQTVSALILGDLSNIATTSASWNQAYSYFTWLTANSGSGGGGSGFNTLSALILGDLTNIASTSATWNTSYNYILGNSGIIYAGYNTLTGLSAEWSTAYTFLTANSAFIFGDLSNIATTSANWNTAYTFNNTNSAYIIGDLTNLAATSANWNNTYSVVDSSSANWNNTYTNYSQNSASYATYPYVNSNFLALSGGTVNGNVNFAKNVTIYGSLSVLSASYFATSIFTSSSALSVIDFGSGPALYIAELGPAGDVASFYDAYGEVLHVGNRSSGLQGVGVFTGEPFKALTVVGDISATATVYASALEVGVQTYPNAILPNIVAQFTSNNNTYQQINNTNLNPGSAASSDYVATADNGNDTSFYVDLGINSSTYADPTFNVAGGNAAYLYNNGGDLAIGTSTTNALKFFTNGTLSSNIAMYIAPGGNVGIGPAIINPGATLTISGNLSTNGVISDGIADSRKWDSTYTSVNQASASWTSGVGVNGGSLFAVNSAYFFGDVSALAATSATWNASYSYLLANSSAIYSDTNTLTALSAYWSQAYSYFTWLTANSGNNVGGSAYQANSALILGDLSNLATTSAYYNASYSALTATSGNWNSAYTFANTYSGYLIGDESSIAATSATWNAAWSFSSSNSALILGDLTNIATTSANWNAGYSALTATSGNWNAVYSTVNANSAFWAPGVGNNGGTLFAVNSAMIFGDITNVNVTSANWNTAYTFTNNNSALILGDLTNIATTSANWNTSYTFNNTTSSTILNDLTNVSLASAGWNTASGGNYLALSGGSVNGLATFNNLVVLQSLSALSAVYLGTTITTSYSSLSVVDYGPGPALFVQENSSTGSIASFNDTYGNVLFVGNRGSTTYNGLVGINTNLPQAALTVSGSLSTNDVINDKAGTSTQWNTAYTFNNSTSALILGDLTVVATNSANWNPGNASNGGTLFANNSAMIFGDLTAVNTTSGQWNQAYSYFTWLTANSGSGGSGSGYPSASALILGDLTNIATTSANWNASYTFTNSNSALILGDLSVVAANSAYWGGDLSNIASTSGNWNAGYTFANSYSGYLIGDESSVAATSATWNSAYTFANTNSALILGDLTNVATTSTNWNASYTFNNSTSALILGDLTVVATNSASWNPGVGTNGGTLFAANSAMIFGDLTNVNTNSAYWTAGYTFANTYSGYLIGDESSVAATSANWNQAYSYFTWLTANSGAGGSGGSSYPSVSALILGDLTNIATTSAIWNSSYSALTSTSASWVNTYLAVSPNSAYWTSGYTFANTNSALILGDLSNIASTSANWNNTYSVVSPSSANWNNTYTSYAANSANFPSNTYVNTHFLALSGGTVTGNTTFQQNVTIYGTLSVLSASYFQTSIFTSSSALSVIDVGPGPALYVAELGTAGDVASFYDVYGEVLHIGNRQNAPYNGLVGINNGAPNKALTVVGDVSSTASVYASALLVGYNNQNITLPYIVGQFTSNYNGYQQVNNQNQFNGNLASTDFVATANNGTDTTFYIDMGINNSSYSDPTFNVTTGNDGYLYTQGGALALGTASNNPLKFFVNGALSSNIAMYVAAGGNVGIGPAIVTPGAALTVSGTLSTNNVINDATGTSTQWNNAYSYFTWLTANSGSGGGGGSGYPTVSALILGDLTNIATTSGSWNAGYTFANSYSGYLIGDESSVAATSATWNAAWSFSSSNSALILGDLTNLATTSGLWNADHTVTAANSANWNQSYTYFTWLTANSGTGGGSGLYLPLSGGTVTGNLTVNGTTNLTSVAATSSVYIAGSGSFPDTTKNERIRISNSYDNNVMGSFYSAPATNLKYINSGWNVNTYGNYTAGYVVNGTSGVLADTYGETYLTTQASNNIFFGTLSASGGNSFTTTSTVFNEYARFNSNGYLGINNTSPAFRLHVNGDVGVSGTIYDAANTSFYLKPSGTSVLQTGIFNTQVGINTATPFSKLTVAVPATNTVSTADSSNTAGIVVAGTGNLVRLQLGVGSTTEGPYGGWIQASYDNGGGANGTEPLLLNPVGGNVGIGTTTPTYTLQVNGTFAASSKSFIIDHPTKAGKKLVYGVTEGPEHSVFIRGRSKQKVIQLPDYWVNLVDESSITVQLTPIGKGQSLYVVSADNKQVVIDNSSLFSSNVDFYYFIQGERKDIEKLIVEVNA